MLFRILLLSTICFLNSSWVLAQGGHLSTGEIERLKSTKMLIAEVDHKPLSSAVHELEKTNDPNLNLLMREAMAHTYADLVKDQNITKQGQKEWLYSMVQLNMAYLQFGGSQGTGGKSKTLNTIICRKLKEYLPADITKRHGFISSVE